MGTTTHAPTDRITCPPDHKHGGNSTCYAIHKCRCDHCRTGRAERERTNHRLKAYGRYDSGLVDAAPVRAHVIYLSQFGMGPVTIAKAAGVGTTAVRTLRDGREDYHKGVKGPRHGETKKRVSRTIAEKILAVEPELKWLGERMPYPAQPTQRRIQALMCLGWSMSNLSRLLGCDQTSLSRTMRQTHTWAARAREVEALYERLWDKKPVPTNGYGRATVTKTKKYAAEHGFVPPLAWDDIDTDLEPPTQDPSNRSEALDDDVTRLHSFRYGDARIGAELHVDKKTVWKMRQRLGLPGWSKEQQEAAA